MSSSAWAVSSHFYPRPPRGGRRTQHPPPRAKGNFYPRPPRGGRPAAPLVLTTGANFYPRPPRGGRLRIKDGALWAAEFLSTPSARRATHPACLLSSSRNISIHALREEGDAVESEIAAEVKISIHALREEGDPAIAAAYMQCA